VKDVCDVILAFEYPCGKILPPLWEINSPHATLFNNARNTDESYTWFFGRSAKAILEHEQPIVSHGEDIATLVASRY
jgi:hypothetical protein